VQAAGLGQMSQRYRVCKLTLPGGRQNTCYRPLSVRSSLIAAGCDCDTTVREWRYLLYWIHFLWCIS